MKCADVGLFVREDVGRPENRINVALFGCLGIDAFRTEILVRLCLPPTAVVFPPQNVMSGGGSIRPDLCVCDHGEVIAWIEVELGSDTKQLDRFRQDLREPVIAIWGTPAPPPSMQLTDVAKLAGEISEQLAGQQTVNLQHLAAAIEEGIGGHTHQTRTHVSEEMASTGFFATFSECVGGVEPVSGYTLRGRVYGDTVSENGYSIRVNSAYSKASGGTVSVFNRSAGRPYIEFNSRELLLYYLPAKQPAIARLASLARSLGANIDSDSGRTRRVPLNLAEEHVREIAEAVRDLANDER
ncbi:MAG: hypothetical protein WD208_12370 [Dehalococcoidia bacterium]